MGVAIASRGGVLVLLGEVLVCLDVVPVTLGGVLVSLGGVLVSRGVTISLSASRGDTLSASRGNTDFVLAGSRAAGGSLGGMFGGGISVRAG